MLLVGILLVPIKENLTQILIGLEHNSWSVLKCKSRFLFPFLTFADLATVSSTHQSEKK